MTKRARGRQVFMDTLAAHGVRYLFGNPGTTESPILDSLAEYPDITYVVALHEGVALGAASFYAQASGATGVVNLHVAPGLGNAIGMIYNALKARSPLVVTAGQQDTRLRLREPVLGHDLVAMAAPVTKWSVQAERADELALLLRRAFKVAQDPPAGPVFVALPIDVMAQETEEMAAPPGDLYRAALPDPAGVAAAAELLAAAKRPAIVAGDDVARASAHDALLALAELLGAPVWVEGLRMHVAAPSAHPNVRASLPYDAAALRSTFAESDAVLLVGGPFFEEVWYAPGSPFPDGAAVIQLEESPARLAFNLPLRVGIVGHAGHALGALRAAVESRLPAPQRAAAAERNAALRALKSREADAQRQRAEKRWNASPISVPRALAEIRDALPPNAIVVDEAITASLDLARTIDFARTGDYFGARGGGIGQALPGALGVKIAHPDRPVVAISGDGSAMYSIQALWTAAHHDLAVVFVILSNREYRILKHNLDAYRQRFGEKPGTTYPHMDLYSPDLGFVDLARGLGVPGVQVSAPAELGPALAKAMQAGRPYLVEVRIEGRP